MPTTKENDILRAYEQWSPDESTVSELASELGISRQRLYQILEKHSVTPKTRRRVGDAKHDDALLAMMAENALTFLLDQLQGLRNEVKAYRARYGPLDPRHPQSDTDGAESTTR